MVKQLHSVNFEMAYVQLFMYGTNISPKYKYKPRHLFSFV